MKSKSTIFGLVLLFLFFVQFFFKLEWVWLFELQQEEMYKRWSGLGLALLITFQWVLSITKVVKKLRKNSIKMTAIHKWLGALSPLFFYVHSMGLGYGYLALLAYVFFTNALIGYINLDVIKNNSDLLFKGWMIFHVSFSIIITVLMFFHIGVVFYYK
tara:strand:- start:7430 stop:7903 length:474 start_codon:yes stop_codon:yes gene_type:complete